MSNRVHFSLNPRKSTHLPSFGYPAPPASSWVPSIQKSSFLALGFPWGAWAIPSGSRRRSLLTLDAPIATGQRGKVPKSRLPILVSEPVFADSTVWRWARGSGRSLVWLVPPPPPPTDGPTPRTDHIARFHECVYRRLGRGALAIKTTDPDDPFRDRHRPAREGWWDLLGPLEAEALFRLDSSSADKFANETKGEIESIFRVSSHPPERWRILASSQDDADQGLAVSTPYGEGKVVFLLARTPEDEEQGERLTSVVRALHEDLWVPPGAASSAQSSRDSSSQATAPGPAIRGSGSTITPAEIAKRLTDRGFHNKTWSADAVRHRLDRAVAENRGRDLFADIATTGYEVNGRRRYPTGPVLDILNRYLASWDEEVKRLHLDKDRALQAKQIGRDLAPE